MNRKVIIISIIVLIFFAGSISAQTLPDAGLTPDSPFYFLDTLREKIGLFFTFGAEKKAEKALKYAEEKLAEAKLMAEKNKADVSESATEAYQGYLDFANQETIEAKKRGRDVEELATLITETTLKHQEVLVEVFEKVPEQAKTAIEKAIEVSRKGSENAVQSVSGAKKEELLQRIEEMEVRIEVLEGKVKEVEQEQETQWQSIEELQKEQEATQAQLEKEKACNEYNRILAEIKDICRTLPYLGTDGCIWEKERSISFSENEATRQVGLSQVNELKELKPQYLSAAQGCGISLEAENQKSQQYILKNPIPAPSPSAISNVQISDITETSAVISWDTDKNGGSKVMYKKNCGGDAGKMLFQLDLLKNTQLPTQEGSGNTTKHIVSLSNLEPGTSYCLVAKSDSISSSPFAFITYPYITVSLSPDTPGEGCISPGAQDVVAAKINFTNNGSVGATISSIGVYLPSFSPIEGKLYDGATQLGLTQPSNNLRFSNLNWIIPANSTKTLIIKFSIHNFAAIGSSGKTGIGSPPDITASMTVLGTFPIYGYNLSVCGGQ